MSAMYRQILKTVPMIEGASLDLLRAFVWS
jgi:hypothetical protein